MLRRRGLAGSLLAFAALPPPRAAEAASAANLTADGTAARLVVTLPPGGRWQIMAWNDPPRLVLEFPGTGWRGPARLAGAGPVRGARAEAGRLVLDLAGPVQLRGVSEAGGRLRVLIAPGPAAAFARAASASQPLAQGGQ
ncbi:MAG: N-acetylmuramoyl-L-alanine amidase, partial [Roseomonas sp.]|nr:N-acetylmuramoyl-L-alanine amidase [Roseomonas sp.]